MLTFREACHKPLQNKKRNFKIKLYYFKSYSLKCIWQSRMLLLGMCYFISNNPRAQRIKLLWRRTSNDYGLSNTLLGVWQLHQTTIKNSKNTHTPNIHESQSYCLKCGAPPYLSKTQEVNFLNPGDCIELLKKQIQTLALFFFIK